MVRGSSWSHAKTERFQDKKTKSGCKELRNKNFMERKWRGTVVCLVLSPRLTAFQVPSHVERSLPARVVSLPFTLLLRRYKTNRLRISWNTTGWNGTTSPGCFQGYFCFMISTGTTMRVFVLVALLVVVGALCVTATSPPRCDTCAPDQCPKNEETQNCACGTHKDYCGCCDFCNKCPEQECIPLHQHRCSDGHTCELDTPNTAHLGGKGKCKPSTSS